MPYVIYGAGAIGGVIASRLLQQGEDVTVIARGANREALETRGLRLQSADGDWTSPLKVVGHPRDVGMTPEHIVVLAMKTQDTLPAVEELATCAPPETPILCAQNGVENERIAVRRFETVYGLFVFIFGTQPKPGFVQCFTAPSFGGLDIGRYPDGLDDLACRIARTFVGAGFDSVARPDIMRWKYAKLIANLGNALAASYGDLARVADLYAAVRDEGRACFQAAGIDAVGDQDAASRFAPMMPPKLVEGAAFPGGSTWQSLARGSSQTEVDYLTGEIVMLGRIHGVPTPVNGALQRQVRTMVAERTPPASLDPSVLRARLTALGIANLTQEPS